MKRICKICGKEFETKYGRKLICDNVHYQKCPDCGKFHELKKSCYQTYLKTGPMRCWSCRSKAISASLKNMSEEAKKSRSDKIKSTCLKKYGVDNPLKSKEVRNKMLHTIQEKYGVESNISQSNMIQEKIRQNSLKKYGVEHPNSSPEVRSKLIQGMIDKYGVDNAGKSSEIQERKRTTLLQRYGVDNPAKSEIVQEHMKQTCIERYGVPYALQADGIRQQIKETCKQKYGINSAPSGVFLNKLQDKEFKSRYNEFTSSPRQYIESHYGHIELSKLVKELNLDFTTVYEYVDKNELWDIVSKAYSTMETDVYDFIKSIDNSIEVLRNDRSIIAPYELDLYLPQYKLGIECNPTFTHNSTLPSYTSTSPLDMNYHRMKSDLAESNGISLFHIFGYEWSHRQHVIQSMLRSLLHRYEITFDKNNVIVAEISELDATSFLNDNSLEGYIPASVRLGLLHRNRLVQMMTFSHIQSCVYEVVSHCSLLNTHVVDGEWILFHYFIEHYHPKKIVTYSDFTHADNTFGQLGFRAVSKSEPNYVWVNIRNDTYRTSDTSTKLDSNYVKVYDSGNIEWMYSLI